MRPVLYALSLLQLLLLVTMFVKSQLLGVKLKIRHGAIVDNVTNLYAKFDDVRLWNEKALVLTTTQEEQQQRT